MPRTLRAAAYGPEYEALLLEASQSGRVTIPCPSTAHARTLRGRVYSYFAALRKENTRADLIEKAALLSVAVTSSALVLYPASETWDAITLREGLGFDPAVPLPTPDSPMQVLKKKLEAIRETKGTHK